MTGKPKSLILRVAEPKRLRCAWHEVQSGANPRSAGLDEQTIAEFASNKNKHLRELRDQLRSGTYKMQPYRPYLIKKNKSKPLTTDNARPISIPTVRDRVVQRAVYEVIWPKIRNDIYTKSSFGGIRQYFTRGKRIRCQIGTKNIKSAAEAIRVAIDKGMHWIFETDIENFYTSINRKKLLKDLSATLGDCSLDDILASSLDTGIPAEWQYRIEVPELWADDVGVPQGGVLSPVMANYYLRQFDRRMDESGYHIIRYVDDFVVLTHSKEKACDAYQLASRLLSSEGLGIHPLDQKSSSGRVKTRIINIRESFEFLGLRFYKDSVQPTADAFEALKAKVEAITDTTRKISKRGQYVHASFIDMAISLNRLVDGWMAAYGFCDISRKRQNEMDSFIIRRVSQWLKHSGIVKRHQDISKKKILQLGVQLPSSHQFNSLVKKIIENRKRMELKQETQRTL